MRASNPSLDLIGNTPLLPLTRLGAGLAVPVLAKHEHMNPGGSVKDRIARAIVEAAEAEGRLGPGATIIEATAGNTGVGLALMCADRGYRLVCVMPEKMSMDKRLALRALGAEVVMTVNAPPTSPDNFQQVARRLALEKNWFLADQFNNPANPGVHEASTAVEILAQTGGVIGAFVAGAGTGGTITGVGRALKRHDPSIRIVLADPAGSGLASWIETGVMGPDGAYAVEGIGSSQPPTNLDRSVLDAAVTITDDESFETTRRLVQDEGLLVGGSSGTNVAAALCVAAWPGLLGPVVTVLPDRLDRYMSKPWVAAWADQAAR